MFYYLLGVKMIIQYGFNAKINHLLVHKINGDTVSIPKPIVNYFCLVPSCSVLLYGAQFS